MAALKTSWLVFQPQSADESSCHLWFQCKCSLQVLFITVTLALPSILRFLCCIVILFIAFSLCGWLLVGHYHPKVRQYFIAYLCLFIEMWFLYSLKHFGCQLKLFLLFLMEMICMQHLRLITQHFYLNTLKHYPGSILAYLFSYSSMQSSVYLLEYLEKLMNHYR